MLGVKTGVKWKDKSFTRKVGVTMNDNLGEAARFLRDAIVDNLSQVQGSYVPAVHSKPGDFPYFITRDLIKSWKVFQDRRAHSGMVYSTLFYSWVLEDGHGRIAARPYIRPAFRNHRRVLGALMTQKM